MFPCDICPRRGRGDDKAASIGPIVGILSVEL